MVLIKYEDLLKNPLPELQRFCDFIGLEQNGAILEQVAEKASFNQMRAREARYGMSSWNSAKGFFVRRGKAGSHRDEMPPDVLEAFLSHSTEILRSFGSL